jgi:hypothetical protein
VDEQQSAPSLLKLPLGVSVMTRARKTKRSLVASDFAGDGEPYTEVTVTISIRILGAGITRSRLAVNVCPDAALEQMARGSLKSLGKEHFTINEHGHFGVCLSDNLNGSVDLEDDYPRIAEEGHGRDDREHLQAMNAYIKDSVDWALILHRQGMEEAVRNDQSPGKGLIM